MKKLMLLLLLVFTCSISKSQTINITSNTTWSTYTNLSGAEINISDNVELTLTGNLTNYGTINLLGCNSKLTIGGAFTGNYNSIDINRHCNNCTDINNLSQGYPYSNGYLSAGNLSYVDINCVQPLPVELIELSCNDKTINWSTGAEINNSHFTIEYSTDGITWVSKGEIYGQGNTQEVTNYEYPITQNGYYRLYQTDYDGTTEFFDILFCNKIEEKEEVKLIAIYDLLGQKVQDDFSGMVIEVYSDGSVKKVLR